MGDVLYLRVLYDSLHQEDLLVFHTDMELVTWIMYAPGFSILEGLQYLLD